MNPHYIIGFKNLDRKKSCKVCQVIQLAGISTIVFFVVSCKKFVAVEPPKTVLISQTVFNTNATATSALLGIYSTMMQDQSFASISTTRYTGLSSDELTNYSVDPAQNEIYENSLSAVNTNIKNYWADAYKYIYAANSLIEGLSHSNGVSESVKRQLIGEAKFIRAFCHFYLVNLFGDIPLITLTNYHVSSVAGRTPKTQVYQQITADLIEAQDLLPDFYVKSDNSVSTERTRPNKWSAIALLARVYLYLQNWSDAETLATLIINNTAQFSLEPDLNNVFLKNSKESIWQLLPVRTDMNTWEGNSFILTAPPSGIFALSLSNQLQSGFEPGDLRRTKWIDSFSTASQSYYYPFKYKIKSGMALNEYYVVFRLAEQYLIRAEARMHQNNITGAISDLNIIRTRAGLPALVNTLSLNECRYHVEQERRIELFAEWGHRWLDLKRTERADAILSAIKTGWQSADVLYPIPEYDILNNPNISQNPGY